MRRSLITLSLIMLLALAPIGAQRNAVDSTPKAGASITIEAAALSELREAANQALLVRQAVTVAAQILTDRTSPCVVQNLAHMEEAAVSRENKRDALILAYRYKHQVPPDYVIDLSAGVSSAPTKGKP